MKRSSSRVPLVLDIDAQHTLKNYLSVVLGYCDFLLRETSADDPRHGDLLELQGAAKAALTMIDPERAP